MEITTCNLPMACSSVEQFLDCNEVKQGWKRLILEDGDLKASLESIIASLGLTSSNTRMRYSPAADLILRAFAYCEPEDVKVVIIGSSPMPDDDKANGLSFSSERMERAFYQWKGKSIQRFHEALKKAEILCGDVDYYCGHKEWAKKGVLLLNAALTISCGMPSDMRYHCCEWRPFLARLLKMWIQSIRPSNKIFVLLLGYAEKGGNENFAVQLWGEACSLESNELVHIRHVDHPTFPNDRLARNGVQNNFIIEATAFFKDMREVYPNMFKTAKIQRIKQQLAIIDKSISLTDNNIDGINYCISDVNGSIMKMNKNLKHIKKGIDKINHFTDQVNEIFISTDLDTTTIHDGIRQINDGIDHINKAFESINSSVASISSGISRFKSSAEDISSGEAFGICRYKIEAGKEYINEGVENYIRSKESICMGINCINGGIECIHTDMEFTNEQEQAIKESIKRLSIAVESIVDVGKQVAKDVEALSRCIENNIEKTESKG